MNINHLRVKCYSIVQPPSLSVTSWQSSEEDFIPTLSLCSFLLTMTAVICWSMNSRMVTSSAGRLAARYTHQGVPPKGGTNQPRLGFVGYETRKRYFCV